MSESKVRADAEEPFLANRPLRVLFVPFGSEGDVNPLLWLAEGMAARGHLPTFMITPHYGHLVERRGLPWLPIGTEREFVRFFRDPHLWHETRGPRRSSKACWRPCRPTAKHLQKRAASLISSCYRAWPWGQRRWQKPSGSPG